jgi:hypothetical protein
MSASPLLGAALTREAIEGIAFFAVLLVLLLYAFIARMRDVHAGHSKEEVLARARKRLPWVMGVLLGACAYVMVRSL